MGLFSVRWILKALGKVDFGLYSVVGGLIVFILFIGSTLAGSVQRFYAYAIGQKDPENIKKWFNCAFVLHSIFSILLVLIGIPVGNYMIDHVMDIPADRIVTCHWVYYFSILTAVGTMMTTPYLAMLYARQRIFEITIWQTLQSVFSFGLAWYILGVRGDVLLFYAAGVVCIKLFFDIVQIWRGYSLFGECRIKRAYWFDKRYFRELLSFASWKLIRGLGVMLKNQGVALLTNIYAGPKVNASLGVGNQVGGQCYTISATIFQAMSPEITSREGAGERDRMISLSLRASKFTTLMSFLWLFPLCGNLDYILKLWLGDVPQYTEIFCQIILIAHAVENLSIGYAASIDAKGKIRGYVLTQGIMLIATFPMAWMAYIFWKSPVLAVSSLMLTSTLVMFARVYWVKILFNFSSLAWVKKVLIPCAIVAVFPCIICCLFQIFLEHSTQNFLISSILSVLSILYISWYYGIDFDERKFVLQKVNSILFKLKVI